jgi:hypothetical protein
VRISHGHKFPQSEEAINVREVEFFVLAPSGERVRLEPAVSKTAIAANYSVKEEGLHRIVLLQDRGVISRTPKGVQAGGRDKHPDATQAYRTLRSAVAYAATSKASSLSGKPAGLEFELAGEYSDGAWQLVLMNHGKPVPEAPIEVFFDRRHSGGFRRADGSEWTPDIPAPGRGQSAGNVLGRNER